MKLFYICIIFVTEQTKLAAAETKRFVVKNNILQNVFLAYVLICKHFSVPYPHYKSLVVVYVL